MFLVFFVSRHKITTYKYNKDDIGVYMPFSPVISDETAVFRDFIGNNLNRRTPRCGIPWRCGRSGKVSRLALHP